MKESIRISLNEEKMEVLLSWIFGKFEPQLDMPQDKRLLSQLKNACEKLGMIDLWDDWNFEEEDSETKKEQVERVAEIRDNEGIFYCSVCKVRTSQKTPTTTCVVCNTSLIRG